MHYHCEIIMPPTDDVEAQVKEIMAPFDEHEEENTRAFWDFWVIGGRWAGAKMKARLDPDKLKAFEDEIQKRKVTVSGFQAGKHELSPADQIPMVDALWAEYFPQHKGKACPLFQHSNDQYDSGDVLEDDICQYSIIPPRLRCERVIFAGPRWDDKGVKATAMFCAEFWNGVNHQETKWDGAIGSAKTLFAETVDRYRPEYAAKITPQLDWLVVTVDYHS